MSAARVKECLHGGYQGCTPTELDLICHIQVHHLTREEKALVEPNQSLCLQALRVPLGIYFKDRELQERVEARVGERVGETRNGGFRCLLPKAWDGPN